MRPLLLAGFVSMVPIPAALVFPAQAPTLADVASLDSFKARFNADTGNVRVVLLLSPT